MPVFRILDVEPHLVLVVAAGGALYSPAGISAQAALVEPHIGGCSHRQRFRVGHEGPCPNLGAGHDQIGVGVFFRSNSFARRAALASVKLTCHRTRPEGRFCLRIVAITFLRDGRLASDTCMETG